MARKKINKLTTDNNTIAFTGSVDIFEAQSVKATLSEALADNRRRHCAIDLLEAERIDVTAYQVFRSFSMSASQAGWQVEYLKRPDLTERLLRVGLEL